MSRATIDMRLMIDRSASMVGERWQRAISAAQGIISRLGPEDLVSIVTFDHAAETVLPPSRVGDRHAVNALLGRLTCDGNGTNIAAAIAVVHAHPSAPGAVGIVVLLSDEPLNDINLADVARLACVARFWPLSGKWEMP